jgi:hypothetical protein
MRNLFARPKTYFIEVDQEACASVHFGIPLRNKALWPEVEPFLHPFQG